MVSKMKLSDLIKIVTEQKIDSREDYEVKIVLDSYGHIGGTKTEDVKYVSFGFDWDNGKFLITPEQTLTSLTKEQLAEIHQSMKKGSSWHAYQSYKKQQSEIDRLTKENEALKKLIEKKDDR